MSAFEFKLPDIGEGVTEGEIVEWHVQPGDAVNEDDPMVEVMTDKATVTIGAPKKGTIAQLNYEVGATAAVGTVLVVIDTAGGGNGAAVVAKPATEQTVVEAEAPKDVAPKDVAAKDDGPAATAVGDIREGLPGSSYFQSAPTAPPPAPAVSSGDDYFREKPLATPATRKLARDLGVDLRRVRPTGKGGRVSKDDIRGFHSGGATPAPTSPTARAAPPRPARAPTTIDSGEDPALEDRKPFVGIRRKIAERMQHTKNTAAHFTFVEECHCDSLVALRSRLKEPAAEQGVRLSYLPFIVKAVIGALKKNPSLNSALDEANNQLVTRRYYHIGIAAATDAGLMVPVVRNADRLSIVELAKEIERLGEGARAGTLTPQELSGSTFTITSLGKQGGLFATPILNHPEVGILGVHQMKQKPVVRNNAIVIGSVMLLSLSFDHRIVDGHIGAAFAYDVIGYLENPDSLFLEMA
ncbi:MAG: dihydrolipoamide acetyltransferase family protein [Myxococcota bacterium]